MWTRAMDRIVQKLLNLGERGVPSRRIGEMVMEELYKLDKVAYIRFASVYRSFQDADDFHNAIKEAAKTAEEERRKKILMVTPASIVSELPWIKNNPESGTDPLFSVCHKVIMKVFTP